MKETIKLYTPVVFILFLSACAEQNWYNGMQEAHRTRCMNEPVSTYEECMREADKDYNDYERQRESLSDDKK